MSPRRLVLVALATESALAGLALAWMQLRGMRPRAGDPFAGALAGLIAAAAIAVTSHYLLHRAPAIRPVRSIRRVYGELLIPLFADLRTPEIVAVALMAGIGEELLFRGAMQAEWGIAAASALFGLAHIGGGQMIAFGVWAAIVGGFLGWLANLTDGLLAPIVAHAVYDAAALAYIRQTSRSVPPAGTDA